MSTTTRRLTTEAAHWRNAAACQGTDTEAFFDDTPDMQRRVQGVCRGCPVRTTCLVDAVAYDDDGYMVWGIAGGLTHLQRRALRVEAMLGNTPNLRQAHRLASPGWAPVLTAIRDLDPAGAARELRQHSLLVSPVTARVALWWVGGKGSILTPKQDGDGRQLWERVRDESHDTVGRLREMGLGNRDVAAYLGVSEDALSRAVHAWRRTEGQVAA